MNSDSLIQSVQDFFAVLEQHKIYYVLVGGIAIFHYESSVRNQTRPEELEFEKLFHLEYRA